MALIKYFKPYGHMVFGPISKALFARAVFQWRSLFRTPWALKLKSKFNRKVTKYFLSALEEFGLQICALVWFWWVGGEHFDLQQDCNLGKCTRLVAWISNPSPFLDSSYYALKSILITTSHACSDVPFPKALTLEKRGSSCVFTE